jgi:hypothetical protein
VDVLVRSGFEEVKVVAHFDCFRATSKEKVARKYGVQGANLMARRAR